MIWLVVPYAIVFLVLCGVVHGAEHKGVLTYVAMLFWPIILPIAFGSAVGKATTKTRGPK